MYDYILIYFSHMKRRAIEEFFNDPTEAKRLKTESGEIHEKTKKKLTKYQTKEKTLSKQVKYHNLLSKFFKSQSLTHLTLPTVTSEDIILFPQELADKIKEAYPIVKRKAYITKKTPYSNNYCIFIWHEKREEDFNIIDGQDMTALM